MNTCCCREMRITYFLSLMDSLAQCSVLSLFIIIISKIARKKKYLGTLKMSKMISFLTSFFGQKLNPWLGNQFLTFLLLKKAFIYGSFEPNLAQLFISFSKMKVKIGILIIAKEHTKINTGFSPFFKFCSINIVKGDFL